MPKNAVQRLQKIENDIKTVISIYDVSTKLRGNDKFEKEEESNFSQVLKSVTAKYTDTREPLDSALSNALQPTFLESFKKLGKLMSRQPQDISSQQSVSVTKKCGMSKKPGSAPSSSSTLSKICEPHYVWQPSSDSNNSSKLKWERGTLSKTRTADNLKTSEWIDSTVNFPAAYEVLMTPSKALETANEILVKNNFGTFEESEVSYSAKEHTEDEEYEREIHNNHEAEGYPAEKNSMMDFEKIKSSLTPTRGEIKSDGPGPGVHLTSRSFALPRNRLDPKKDKSTSEISPTRHIIPKKIQRIEKQRTPELRSGGQRRSDCKELQEKENKSWSCVNNIEGKNVNQKKTKHQSESVINEGIKSCTPSKLKHAEKNSGTLEENLREGQTDEDELQNDQKGHNSSDPSCAFTKNQRTSKTSEAENPELGAQELFKIIEKSNEKLEKMKISKDLALDIAKQLKEKYEEIQQSKEEMMEKLKNVEKDNERLNNEVKDAYESKKKLQLKMEGFRIDSRTILLEQDVRSKELMDENKWLKCKISELEKKHNEELLEKEREIDRIQRERFIESRNELKAREDRVDDVQRLTNEKSELLAKIDELHCFLHSRHLKEETLEEKIGQLQEEVQRQRQHLKRKTERLEDTNRELEQIRKNSKDLEEQVKTLRSHIENFDQMQQNLMKERMDYEKMNKSNEEEVKKLREENAKLKSELENERDSLLIKNKIIEDQQETIKQMREKSEEAKTLLKKNQSLERILNVEREEKLELQEAVERLKWRKDELKKKVKTLESDLLLAPQEVVRDLQKTQIVLHELENQVQIKQKEWELHLQSLIKEKEQACSVAEFATKKLMQTTSEFQKQSEAQKRLHRALAENLAEKEKNLREANEKASHSQVKQIISDIHPDSKFFRSRQYNSDSDITPLMSDWHSRSYPDSRSEEATIFTGW